MEFGIIGTSIWQQNMPLLELLTIDREVKAERLQELKEALGISELIYLATCNRVEFFYAIEDKYPPGNILHRLIYSYIGASSSIKTYILY